MHILGMIVAGLIIVAIAKLLMPGGDRMGCISTILPWGSAVPPSRAD